MNGVAKMPKVGMQPIRRRQLIDATLEAINEVGMHDATIAQIARRAGVSTGIISHYFKDKNGLLEATLVNLDSKGRLSVPTRYRDELNENASGQMVCTIDINHSCLLLYPLPEWEIIEQKLSRLSSMNPQERRVQRLLLGHASECQMDSAGRLLIAPILRQHAGLTKELMLVGQFNKFELWDETTWYQQVKDDIDAEQSDSATLSDRLQDLSL
jgi:MraZ protein